MFETNMQSHKLLLAALLVVCFANSIRAEDSLFERDVLPILTKNCLGCHGGLLQKGGLDMRTIPLMHKGGKSGPALKVGDVNASEIWKRIAADEMPPGEKKLSAAEKNHIKQWIAGGLPTVAERQKKNDDPLLSKEKHTPREVAAAIDRHLQNGMATWRLKPAPQSDDAEFLRRIHLDLTGRVPTAEQAVAFLDNKEPDKRAKLIDQLLATPQFGEQLGRTWREWICPPELPSDANGGAQPHKQAQELGNWMGKRFAVGDSWDKITRDILTVKGDTKNNPQAIFFGLSGDSSGRVTPDGSARAVASLFMGVQLQCAQCHDDPYRDWSQKDHWALAAFFGRTSGDFGNVRESNPGNNASISIPKTAFKNIGTNIQAAFLNGKKFEHDKSRFDRDRLVDWLAAKDNPYFARAFVNRTWFYFFARGLVNPIDDFRDLNPPTHPGLMNLLTNEFAASGFDVKHLIRCICNSEAYQRTTRVAKGTDEQTVAALTAAFGRMPIRIMTADQLYDSLKQAYGDPNLDLRGINPKDGNTTGMSAPVLDPYIEFLRRFGTNKEDPTDFIHGIPQMLTMINHPRLRAGSKAIDQYRMSNAKAPPEQIVEWLYLSTFSRRPTNVEQGESQHYLKRSPDAYIGILWALVNRSEYLLVR